MLYEVITNSLPWRLKRQMSMEAKMNHYISAFGIGAIAMIITGSYNFV